MTIDLSQLPAPEVVEPLDYESIYQSMLGDFRVFYPDFGALLESDPAIKVLEMAAYRELSLRARINDAARACMLAYAGGADLQHLAALYSVERLVTDPGDPAATPPVPPTYETDASLRYRTQLAPEGFSTAGPEGAYRFHALSASGDVADVAIDSPTPGQVRVAVLSADGDGTPTPQLLAVVEQALTAEDVRPLTDEVIVEPARIVPWSLDAVLHVAPGPTAGPVRERALEAVEAYARQRRALGRDITLSGLYAALHQPGVQRVVLISPQSDIVCDPRQAAWCTGIALTVAGDAL